MLKWNPKYFIGLLSFLAFSACASRQAPGTAPEDMSHEDHLAAAEQEKELAQKHQGQYDPDALAKKHNPNITFGHGAYLWGDPNLDYGFIAQDMGPGTIYNPTDYHRQQAQSHQEHARQHETAAAALEQFEEEECASIHKKVRHLCPFIGTVEKIEETGNGARLFIRDDVNIDGVLAHARCHHAYGAKQGHVDMPACPLYLKRVTIEKTDDGAIEILSDDPTTAKEALERSKTHVQP